MGQRVQGPWARWAHLESTHPRGVARSAAGKAPPSVVFTYRLRLEAGMSYADLMTWMVVPLAGCADCIIIPWV